MVYLPVSARPSVHAPVCLWSPFSIYNLSIYSRNFFKYCIHVVIGDEYYRIVKVVICGKYINLNKFINI